MTRKETDELFDKMIHTGPANDIDSPEYLAAKKQWFAAEKELEITVKHYYSDDVEESFEHSRFKAPAQQKTKDKLQ